MDRPDFGVIGFGRFGQLVAFHLGERGTVRVFDRKWAPLGDRGISDANAQIGKARLEEVCRARFVVFAVPIRALRGALEEAAPYFRHGTLVADTASVKAWPVRWLRDCVPEHVEVIGTHPLFGPDSAGEGLAERKIVVVPVRLRHPRVVRRFLESYGLEVLIRTAEEHDREVARTQALTHWIGRALERFGAEPREIDTMGYRRLLEVLAYVNRDTLELFEDMQRWNPFAAETRVEFLGRMEELHRELDSRGPEEFEGL